MASPHIAGIIANWEVECKETNFHTPCTFDNHKERLKDYSEPVTGSGVRCGNTGVECEAAQYHCGCGFCMLYISILYIYIYISYMLYTISYTYIICTVQIHAKLIDV